MWIVVKIKKKNLAHFKVDIKKKFEDIKFYTPTILINFFKNNKKEYKIINLFNDYRFIYSPQFSKKENLLALNFFKGIKLVLNNSIFNQAEIENFIENCKYHEDKNGYIKQEFFNFQKNRMFKFTSGPFTNLMFKFLEETKNKIKILIGKNTFTVEKNKYLFFPI